MSVRDYLNVEKRSDLRDWIFQNGQAVAVLGIINQADIPLETWYFDETSMVFDDGTDYALAFKPNEILETDPGRYLPTMVLSDWNKTINKPTIPSAQVQSDWNSVSGVSQILNKPSIPIYTAGSGISLIGSVINNTAPNQTVNITNGNKIGITGTYPNFTISYTEPIPTVVARTLNNNFTISTSKQSNVVYVVTCTVTNPLAIGSSSANAFLEYSINSGTSWITVSQNGNSSSVGVVVAIQLTNSQTGILSGTIPANALVRIRTVITGTASVTYITGQETY